MTRRFEFVFPTFPQIEGMLAESLFVVYFTNISLCDIIFPRRLFLIDLHHNTHGSNVVLTLSLNFDWESVSRCPYIWPALCLTSDSHSHLCVYPGKNGSSPLNHVIKLHQLPHTSSPKPKSCDITRHGEVMWLDEVMSVVGAVLARGVLHPLQLNG